MKQALPTKHAKHFEKMAELLCRINPGLRIDPFTSHAQINGTEKKIVFVPKSPVSWSEMSRYPGRLLPWFAQDIKHFFFYHYKV